MPLHYVIVLLRAGLGGRPGVLARTDRIYGARLGLPSATHLRSLSSLAMDGTERRNVPVNFQRCGTQREKSCAQWRFKHVSDIPRGHKSSRLTRGPLNACRRKYPPRQKQVVNTVSTAFCGTVAFIDDYIFCATSRELPEAPSKGGPTWVDCTESNLGVNSGGSVV